MGYLRKLLWGLLLCLLVVGLPHATARAGSDQPSIPPGFNLVAEDIGVQLYRKDYAGGSPDFVQLIDLSQGASLELMHAEIIAHGTGKGVYGGNSPQFGLQSLQHYWGELSSEQENAFCVSNGQFFFMQDYPVKMPFPLKVDGVVVTDGYGIDQFPDQKLILELWSDHANIRELTPTALYSPNATNIIAGLSENANKSSRHFVGRTFVGVDDRDGDRRFETVLIFTTKTARQVDAAETLYTFGADKVMMLDGGESSQLICRGKTYVPSERLIPQAIGVLAGSQKALALKVLSQPDWPILLEGEVLRVAIRLQNTGTIAWKSGSSSLVIEQPSGSGEILLPLVKDTHPGEQAVFLWNTSPFEQWGVYSTLWYLRSGGAIISERPSQMHVVVLPRDLRNEKQSLKIQLQEWSVAGGSAVQPLVFGWIQERQSHLSMAKKNGLQKSATPPGEVRGIEKTSQIGPSQGVENSRRPWELVLPLLVALRILIARLRAGK